MWVFFRYTRRSTVPSSFRTISVSWKGRELSPSSSYVNLMLPVVSMLLRSSVSSCLLPFLITSITSSSYIFHSLHVTAAMRVACRSNCSVQLHALKSRTTADFTKRSYRAKKRMRTFDVYHVTQNNHRKHA